MPPVELDTIPRTPTEAVQNLKDSYEPVITRSNTTVPLLESFIDDVKTPSAPVVTFEDIIVSPIEPANQVEAFIGGIVDQIASYTLVQTALKTVDFTLDVVEKLVAVACPSTTEYVQAVRRYLRAVRHAGRRHAGHATGASNKKTRSLRDLPSRRRKAMRQASITGYFADLFQLHFILNFLGLELTVAESKTKKPTKASGHYTDDEESTVYKLMKEYDSQDDEDYVPSDSSVDSLEFESDCSEEETTAEKLNKDYVDQEDQDYVPEAASDDSAEKIEYNSEAEVSAAEESQEDVEEAEDSNDAEAASDEGRKESTSSVESTTVDKLMKDSEDEHADEDYVPEEEKSEDSCEYNSDEEAIKEVIEVIEELEEVIIDVEQVHEEDSDDVEAADEVTQDSDDDVEALEETPLDVEDSREDSQEADEEAEIVMVNEAEISQESSQEAEIVMVNEADISQESSQEIVMVNEAEIES